MKNDAEQFVFARAMEVYGGSFAAALGRAYLHADMMNRARIELAFPDLVEKYGPGTLFYAHIEAIEGK